jgi:putative ABC transport system permease protein
LYFVAVILVIIGTYCLFTAVSISILKLLRRNKRFYYKTKNFIGTAGMLYRMKRNAVGLANICILSTMVLVMVSGTLSLFAGTKDALNTRYPADLVAEVDYDPTEEVVFQPDLFLERLTAGVKAEGRAVENVRATKTLSFPVERTGTGFLAQQMNKSGADASMMVFTTAEEYAALTGTATAPLGENEVLLYAQGKKISGELVIDFSNAQSPDGEQRSYHIAEKLHSFPPVNDYSAYLMDTYYVVVADDAALLQLYRNCVASYGDQASMLTWRVLLDVDGTEQEQKDCAEAVSDSHLIEVDAKDVGSWDTYKLDCRAANANDFYSINGGFFFLGIFLGFLFIMATVLIIYYKQMTEGYEDRQRFQIMQKVGLDKTEIRRSINAQILVVFFAPLIVAAIHVAFDFRLVRLLLTLFGLTNATLTLLCTTGTLLAFIVVYGIVYALTAKAYYRIVS